MRDFNRGLVEDVREHGKPTSGPFAGRDVLLLTTKGRRTGIERTNPLVFSRDGDGLVIIASKGGAPTHPDWFRNLRAHPEVVVETGGERFTARATVAEPEAERRRLYDQHSVRNPAFLDYEKKTTRRIPVITLQRVS